MLDLADKDFKAAITNIFRELKKSLLIMSEQMQTLSREMETKSRPNKNPGGEKNSNN